VLASPDTATDQDYYTIQSIVGHEYFHNWSGNRVTCRDWFQLSLKEGFTVLRDQQFSADLNSAVVQRIADVNQLRSMQFAEDAGPMAHPVRPASFIEISNFYTVTIYEKGAEVVGMIKTIVGAEGFRKGTDLYFDRHDGQAVTTDDFVKAIEDANDVDLSQFKRWYSQAGTPVVTVKTHYDQAQLQFSLTLSQHCPATPDQTEKLPFHIPIAVGLLDKDGQAMPIQLVGDKPHSEDTIVLSLTEAEQTFTFVNIASAPVPSVLRGFSAPVRLDHIRTSSELAFLMANDSDSFNRWDAGQQLFINVLIDLINAIQQGVELTVPNILMEQIDNVLADADNDPALVAKMLSIPSENYLAAQTKPADVDAIHAARKFLKRSIANKFKATFLAIYQALNEHKKAYAFNAGDMAQRSLKNTCLGFLMATADPMQTQRCLKQMKDADNMTDLLAGLSLMADQKGPEAEHAIRAFYEQWKHDRQVVDKWLTVQALSNQPDTLLRVKGLIKHSAFSMTNPNNVRAVIGQFCRNNPINFHAKDGSGYKFLAEQIIELNKLNPQVAARQLGAFNSWQQYDSERQAMIKQALQSIAEQEGLSPDVYEVVTKYLAAGE
jgi:aminopeptidase N